MHRYSQTNCAPTTVFDFVDAHDNDMVAVQCSYHRHRSLNSNSVWLNVMMDSLCDDDSSWRSKPMLHAWVSVIYYRHDLNCHHCHDTHSIRPNIDIPLILVLILSIAHDSIHAVRPIPQSNSSASVSFHWIDNNSCVALYDQSCFPNRKESNVVRLWLKFGCAVVPFDCDAMHISIALDVSSMHYLLNLFNSNFNEKKKHWMKTHFPHFDRFGFCFFTFTWTRWPIIECG